MSKIPCDVIKDLLPLYEDGVCSEKSSEIVEGHLEECADCRSLYRSMQGDIPEVTIQGDKEIADDDLKFIKNVKKEYTFRRIITAGIIVLVLLAFLVVPQAYSDSREAQGLPGIRIIDTRIAVSNIHVSELYEMKNGDIYFTLESDKGFTNSSYASIVNTDYNYSDDWTTGWREFECTYSLSDKIFGSALTNHKIGAVMPLTDTVYLEPENENSGHEITRTADAIYYVGKHNEKLTIWKKGQETEPAPDRIENWAKKERAKIAENIGEEYDDILLIYDSYDGEFDK